MKKYKLKIFNLIKRLGFFSFSTITLQVANLIKGFLIPLFLNPDMFGILNKLNLILCYGSYLDLGASNGMGRYLPQHLGSKDIEKAQKVADSTLTINILSSCMFFLLVVLLVISMPHNFNREITAGIIIFSLVLIA